MKLQELMHFEEKLLLFENQNRFEITFSDYIILDKFLSEIENITNLYFQLSDNYKKYINKENITNEERLKKINKYNQKILNEEVNFNFDYYNEFIEKYLNK